jgi:hypothetical protein
MLPCFGLSCCNSSASTATITAPRVARPVSGDALRQPLPITSLVCTLWPLIFLAVLLLAPATVAAMLSAGPLVLARRGCVEPYASHRVLLWPCGRWRVSWSGRFQRPQGSGVRVKGSQGGLSGTVIGHAGFTVAADLISVGDRCGIVHDPTRIEPFTECGEGVATHPSLFLGLVRSFHP